MSRCRRITEKDIDDHLKIANINSPPLDILIRTSGVKRLSDYLLWQVSLLGTPLTNHFMHSLYLVTVVHRKHTDPFY